MARRPTHVRAGSAFVIARRLAGGLAGATAAMLTATSPIVLLQVVQPMNDVLAAALWLSVFAFLLIDRPEGVLPQVSAGIIAGVTILVRPNLAPLALVVVSLPFMLMWDSLDPAWLDRAISWLRERGHQPYFLLERREEPEFRTRFSGHSIYGALD